MTANRNLPLPLVIVFLVLIRGCRSVEPLSEEDYDKYEDDTTTPPKSVTVSSVSSVPSKRCDYDACLDSQPSCAELAASTGCMCPGITLYNVAPEAPKLKKLSREGSEVRIEWCAPYSRVTLYKVTVGGIERQEFGERRRSGTVDKLDDGAEVCVVAVNDAGSSPGSCMMYQHEDNSMFLTAGLVGGALGFLLLFSLGALLCRHRKRRNSEARISTLGGADA